MKKLTLLVSFLFLVGCSANSYNKSAIETKPLPIFKLNESASKDDLLLAYRQSLDTIMLSKLRLEDKVLKLEKELKYIKEYLQYERHEKDRK